MSTLRPQTPAEEAEIAAYPDDVQVLIWEQISIEDRDRGMWSTAVQDADGVWRTEEGHVIFPQDRALHRYFSLSYASWLVLPRLALQEMPPEWQMRFVDLLNEAYDKHGMKSPEGEIIIQRKDPKGRFIGDDPWNDYRRGSLAEAESFDAERFPQPSWAQG